MAKQKPTPPPTDGYTVLARRYRPQTFADLIGQEHVARALVNALTSGRVAHAYLFTGARGVGKTSTARILARALNCDKGPTATPCGTCSACVAIATGEDVDVLEIDGASNRRIDEIREIRNNVQYKPGRSRFKIYIIDEVHMLTKEAFNALLKTLEEPPPHVKFLFATTEVEKVPITILSRCQRFDFAGIGLTPIADHLKAIVKREGLRADDEALELVARRAGGSMRDAQSLLDQLLAFAGGTLTADVVHQALGTAGDDRVAALAAAVLGGDPKQALDLLADAAGSGLQLGELVDQMIAYWRDLMVVRCAGADGRDLSVPPRLREALASQAQVLSLDTIVAGLDVLSATKARLRDSSHARTLVEMALVRLGRLGDLVSVAQLIQALGQAPVPSAGPSRLVPPPEGVKKKLVVTVEPFNGPTELTEATLERVWGQTLGELGAVLAANLERGGVPAISGPNTLALRFPAAYNHEREVSQETASVARVEEALKKVTGRAWTFRVENSGGSVGPAAGEGDAAPPSPPSRSRRNPRDEAEKEPLIRRALDVLGAQIVRVDEGYGTAPPVPPAAPPDEEKG